MENRYPSWAIFNFILLSAFGLLLRYMQVFGLPSANYQFLLHAHSHFAFAGWMFFSISLLIIKSLFASQYPAAYKRVLLLTQLSSVGMLLSFSVLGYHAVSIGFSTMFILVGYRFTYLVCRSEMRKKFNETARLLIYGGSFFLCLSSAGPFALAPLGAAGLKNTPLYQDAIFFYLHFQMNGFMLLAALGLFASAYLNGLIDQNRRVWLLVFIGSVVPLFLIFTLWAHPPAWLWTLSFAATFLNLISWIKLCIFYRHEWHRFPFLVKAALVAVSVKILLQVILCVPSVGTWVFGDRNLIIGYVHLLTLGCIMPLILDQFTRKFFVNAGKLSSLLNCSFMIAVGFYLSALFLQPVLSSMEIRIPHFQMLLLLISFLFPLAGLLYFFQVRAAKSPVQAPEVTVAKYDEAYADM